MGTTLHAHIEVKLDGKWQHFAAPCVERNYILFAVLAAVRRQDANAALGHMDPFEVTTVPWCAKLPEDISEVTAVCHRKESEQYDLHHEGWLEGRFIPTLQQELNRYMSYKAKNGPMDLEEDIFHTYINGSSIAAHDGFEDVRIVFWFDN